MILTYILNIWKGERIMETTERIKVLNMPEERSCDDELSCMVYCPADCGCENAWNTCFIGD